MTFGSPTANNQVNFTNGIDLNGEIRQIDVAAGLGGDSILISGNIIDSAHDGAGLLKTGAGILILSGSNSFTGGVTISSGTLAVIAANGLGAASGTLSIGAATLEVAGNFVDSRNINLTDHSSTIQVDAGQTYANAGAIFGTGALNVAGAGTLVLIGTKSYGGGTNVDAGTLFAATTASLPGYNVASQVSVAGGAVLTVPTGNGATGWNASEIDSLLANTAWSSNTSVLGIDTTQGTLTDGSDISAALALAKMGTGTLVLTGSNANVGGATVEAGTLVLTTPDAIADGANLTVGTNAASIFADAAMPSAAAQSAAAVPEPGTLAAQWSRSRNRRRNGELGEGDAGLLVDRLSERLCSSKPFANGSSSLPACSASFPLPNLCFSKHDGPLFATPRTVPALHVCYSRSRDALHGGAPAAGPAEWRDRR